MSLEATTPSFLRPRSRTRPDLRLVDWNGERAVMKDWGNARLLLRPHARRCLAREWRALQALDGVPGIPRPLERLPDAIVVSHVEGVPFGRKRVPREERRRFFDALEACVARMHARGVLHLDLRQRRNILYAPDGSASVLDFEAALTVDPASAWGRLVLRLIGPIDRLAVLKHRERYAAWTLAPGEQRLAKVMRISRWAWPSAVLHRIRVALRRQLDRRS
jgi:predicted Ser/Thr protein kinase